MAFSPDDKTLPSAGDDWVVQLWDVKTQRELGPAFRRHEDTVSLAFDPTGASLISADTNGNVFVWDPILWSDDWDALRDRICAAVRHSLSRAQWRESLPDEPYRETCAQPAS